MLDNLSAHKVPSIREAIEAAAAKLLYRTRRGARFGVATIHGILTNPVYIGVCIFNKRDSRTLKQKPVKEHVAIVVPAINAKGDFEAVAATLKLRNPKTTPPRTITGPVLLTGVAICASCDGGMTLRTGTSSSGRIHKYYTCSTCARQGKSACKGRSIPMDKLDRKSHRTIISTGPSEPHPWEID